MLRTHRLPKLKYKYSALSPYIDAKTMRIHHKKHHQGYVDKLNSTIKYHDRMRELKIKELLSRLDEVPASIRTDVRNSGGGHLNHTMFWRMMSPKKTEPKGKLLKLIEDRYTDLDNFKARFTAISMGLFGSGWTWLVFNDGELDIVNLPNQDAPVIKNKYPLLGVDVWEHAYYIKYQNRRADYLKAWWNVVNWDEVSRRLSKSK
jgi:Fe-Mn family superoxide dismutase